MKRANSKFWIVCTAALIVGYLLARLDTSENWDDTGITVMAVLLSAFLFGAMQPAYAWLRALLIGGSIFCLNIFKTGNYGSAVAMLFAFIGSYAGTFFRKFIL
jgi:hypothetical protein